MKNSTETTKPNPLTSQQKRFIEEYIKTLNPEQSVIKAGYSRERVHRQSEELLNNPKIIAEINHQAEQRTQRLNADKAFIVKKLLDIVNISTEAEEIFDKTGSPTGKKRLTDSGSALRALDALTKLCLQNETSINNCSDSNKVFCIENLDIQRI